MQFNLSSKIEGVHTYYIADSVCVLVKNEAPDRHLLLRDTRALLELSYRSMVKKMQRYTVVLDKDKKLTIFDGEDLIRELYGYGVSEEPYSNNEVILSKRLSKGVFEKYLYNIEEQSMTPIFEIAAIHTLSFKLFADYDLGKVIFTGECSWQTDVSSYGKIRKILGVAGDNLWISCMSEDENRYTKAHLIALDVHTGDLKHHLSEGVPLNDAHIALLEDRQCIVSYWGKISSHQKSESPFVEIDALTGAVVRNTFSPSLYDANLKLGAWQYQDNKIYFDAAFDTINSTHIGVMDFDTLEVDWFDEVKDRKAGLRNLQVSGDKIYIMDSGNQLFIYEREK